METTTAAPLSAWYVLSSLGLFPTAGTDRYEISGPLWSRAEIQMGSQHLVVSAEHLSLENVYVQRVWLNGKPLDRRWLKHSEISGGGLLRFEMGPRPVHD